MTIAIKSIMLLAALAYCSISQAQWMTQGRDAIFGYSGIDKSTGEEKHVLLVIGFDNRAICRATASLIVMSGKQLGAPVSQKTSKNIKDQLVINIDGKDYTSLTKLTRYVSGIESTMLASNELIEALKRGRSASVNFNSRRNPDFITISNMNGFTEALKKAEANCH